MTGAPNVPARRVVLCSDDAGWDAANDAVILSLARAGRISAVSVLVDGPAAAAWAQCEPGAVASLGLHLNFTWSPGQPSQGLGRLLADAHLGRLRAAEVDARIHAQLQRFESLYGRPPDFVDGHQHVQMLPTLRVRLMAALRARYGAATPALRIPVARHWRGGKAALLNVLGARALGRDARRAGWPANRDFAGAYDFGTGRSYRERMQDWLADIDDLGLVMAHPGCDGPLEHAAARAREAAYFAGADWPADLASAGCRLVPFTAERMRA